MQYRTSDFVVDGALRDICVLDTDVEDWRNVVSALPFDAWEVSFESTIEAAGLGSADGVTRLLETIFFDDDASARMAIGVGGVWFFCYFFELEEMEFTFDPEDIVDEAAFGSLTAFMEWLGEACGKRVVMTMESTDHRSIPALLEYLPARQG
ncbi:hypothetical protein AB0A74_29025 [Saccharothrix sp. NPDC042600]|uniref:hypothetical protein n=1 Tax=Saccharothrix TaxID=2071 RepID=UPI0033CAA63B